MKLDVDVNQFPSLTWNFLNINRNHIDSSVESDAGFTAVVSNDSISLAEVPYSSLAGEIRNIQTGLGRDFDREFDSFAERGKTVLVEFPASLGCSSCQKVKIELVHHDGESKAKDFVIHALPDSNAEVVFTFKGAELNEGVLGVRIRVLAEENARVKVAAVNLLGKKALHFMSLGSSVKDNALTDFTELELGGAKVFSGNHELLCGYRAACTSHTGYVASENSLLDFNYVARQTGRETSSFMDVDGICCSNAVKTWRGTIDFVRGCVDSKGDEQEDVLLLSPKVDNKTLPVILCDEEAVEGRHGASIGRLGKDILFYMQSRGIDEKEAQRLMVSARINSVCRYVSDDEVRESVSAFLEKEFGE